MRDRASDKLLNWGFAAALTLHGMALACAAVLPMEGAKDELAEIRVFEAAAPALMVPVDLVEWPAEEAVGGSIQVAAMVEPAWRAPEPKPAELKPEPGPRMPPEVRPVEKPPAPSPKPSVAATQPKPVPAVPKPEPTAIQPRPTPEPIEVAGRPGGGGGGGGGFVDLGTPSQHGDLGGAASGGTPMGDVPGTGSGSGAGAGAGSGDGSGGGSGGGTGTGQGTGIGPGSGSGTGGGSGDGGREPGFVSRVADRKEPVVVYRGSLEYPPEAVAEGIEGAVKLQVLVSEVGTVAEVTVAGSSHDRRLDAAAVEFVRGWRYEPAVQDGKPRSVYTHAAVTFKLK